MEIKIERIPDDRGGKWILVDGEKWGRVYMEGHGCHGPSYEFSQVLVSGGTAPISRERDDKGELYYRPRRVSASATRKRWARADAEIKTAEQAILETAEQAIAEGLLKHPKVVEKEHREAAKAMLARAEVYDRQQREKAVSKARAIVKGIGLLNSETLTEKIADAILEGVV